VNLVSLSFLCVYLKDFLDVSGAVVAFISVVVVFYAIYEKY
jgi:Na+/H+ antiporter NhaB